MPAENNTDKIRRLEREAATLLERADNLRRATERCEVAIEGVGRSVKELETRMAVLSERLERLEQGHDEARSRRWDLWKIVLGAVLGCLLTLAVGFAMRWLDRKVKDRPEVRPAGVSLEG